MDGTGTHATDTIILAAGATEYTDALVSFAWIMAAALLAPLVAFVFENRIPAVALLLVFGMVIGPSVLDLAAEEEGIGMLKELGVGALFLLAGFEINLQSLRSKQAKIGLSTWLVCAVACGVGAYFLVDTIPGAIVVALALTSTALGTLTPMLKQDNVTGTKVGDSVLIHGAIGELAPITAMALLLGTHDTWTTFLVMVAFIGVAALVAVAPAAIIHAIPGVGRAFVSGAGSTNQTILRLIILILATLMAVAAVFELDIVLGAFAAGIILNRITPDEFHKPLEHRLDVVFYSMLIPVFFVVSGMAINWQTIADNPGKVLGIPALILVTRGLPVYLREVFADTGSGITKPREQLQVGLYSATGLPIIVAVTSLAVDSELMQQQTASIFVAGGALTVAIFPFLASIIGGKTGKVETVEKSTPTS